jgi:hypothetical protein
MKRTTYNRFDLVKLRTTRRVNWLVDQRGQMPTTDGLWSIVCTFPSKGELLCQKGTALIRIPAVDVIKTANYEVDKVISKLTK